MTTEEPPIDGEALARLAGLEPGDGTEIETLAAQARSLLAQFSVLQSLDTDGIPPMTAPQAPELRLRDDEPGQAMDVDEVLANAAATKSGAFLVPRPGEQSPADSP